jgi:hypothetical protein
VDLRSRRDRELSVAGRSFCLVLLTGRQARATLVTAGISEHRTRIALTCELAGPALKTSAALLYDGDQVAQLGRRRVVTHDEIHQRCTSQVFVSRRPVHMSWHPDRLRAELSVIPGQISPLTVLALWRREGGIPFIATVAGFVVLGATIREAHGQHLVLDDPGAWFDGLEDTQLLTGNGRQWKLMSPSPPPPTRAAYVSPVRPLLEWDAEIDVDTDADLDPD